MDIYVSSMDNPLISMDYREVIIDIYGLSMDDAKIAAYFQIRFFSRYEVLKEVIEELIRRIAIVFNMFRFVF